MIRSFRGKTPDIDPSCFVADTASVIGDVVVGARSSIWYGAAVRGDVYYIRIGDETSIQDNTVIHVTHGQNATLIGNRVTVGHSVTLHGCTVGDRCIIGMGSTVLDKAEIGEGSMIGAGALVTPGTKIPSGVLAVGSPARVKRPLTPDEQAWLSASAEHYALLTAEYLKEVAGKR